MIKKITVSKLGTGKANDPYKPDVPYGLNFSVIAERSTEFDILVDEKAWKIEKLIAYLKTKNVQFTDFPTDL